MVDQRRLSDWSIGRLLSISFASAVQSTAPCLYRRVKKEKDERVGDQNPQQSCSWS